MCAASSCGVRGLCSTANSEGGALTILSGTATIVRKVRAVIGVCTLAFAAVGAVMVLADAFLVAFNVLLRELGKRSIETTVDLTEISLIMSVFFGLGATEYHRRHVASDVLTSRLNPRFAQLLEACALIVPTMLVAWASWRSYLRAQDGFNAHETIYGIGNIPLWPARFVIALGWLLLAVQLVFRIGDLFIAGLQPMGVKGKATDISWSGDNEVDRSNALL